MRSMIRGLYALQSFIKVVNYQHMMPTRYTLDVDLKSIVTADVVDNSTKRKEVRLVSAHAALGCFSVLQLQAVHACQWQYITGLQVCVLAAVSSSPCNGLN